MSKKSVVVEEHLGKLGECRWIETRRKDGSIRIQQDFSACPTLTEQHTAHLSDINYLVKKYKPDELTAYLVARAGYRREILGHDFSEEPSLQDAMNHVHRMRSVFEDLNPEIRKHFANHLEFVKFIDNPVNADKMIELGLMTPKEVKAVVEVPKEPTPSSPTT